MDEDLMNIEAQKALQYHLEQYWVEWEEQAGAAVAA
jgi:hypothetical protein